MSTNWDRATDGDRTGWNLDVGGEPVGFVSDHHADDFPPLVEAREQIRELRQLLMSADAWLAAAEVATRNDVAPLRPEHLRARIEQALVGDW